ncbi:MAG: aspartyl/asparaginyl beta-hydroxylase domain-containing protein, partial [Candidatus Obscuribacterales bacterium]|nr:aspartyl/asparaginyl beta-hydroxylase domain-containing protein [Steroidobacteraceae bacterium]
FPRLPAIPFYDRVDFLWLNTVEAAADEIRKELIGVLKDNHDDFVPYVAHPEGAPLNQWQELNNSRRWGAFHLWREGQRVEENLARCPTTASILAKAPSPKMLGHAPNAFFSLLEPRTRIPPHTGVTNTRLVVHVPLVIPPSCGFRVGSITREWQRGKAWVFDDTIEHEAWNNSDEPRAILIFDIWNPYLTEVERELVRTATESIGDFYQGETPYTAGL